MSRGPGIWQKSLLDQCLKASPMRSASALQRFRLRRKLSTASKTTLITVVKLRFTTRTCGQAASRSCS